MIYLEEAHASDEWPIYQLQKDIPQHRTLHDRLAVAKEFERDFCAGTEKTLLADSMKNEFNVNYASWPFRFWVVHHERGLKPRVGFKAMPQESMYQLGTLGDYLQRHADHDV